MVTIQLGKIPRAITQVWSGTKASRWTPRRRGHLLRLNAQGGLPPALDATGLRGKAVSRGREHHPRAPGGAGAYFEGNDMPASDELVPLRARLHFPQSSPGSVDSARATIDQPSLGPTSP